MLVHILRGTGQSPQRGTVAAPMSVVQTLRNPALPACNSPPSTEHKTQRLSSGLLAAVSPANSTLSDIVAAPYVRSDGGDDRKLCAPVSESLCLFFPFQTFSGCLPERPRLRAGGLHVS